MTRRQPGARTHLRLAARRQRNRDAGRHQCALPGLDDQVAGDGREQIEAGRLRAVIFRQRQIGAMRQPDHLHLDRIHLDFSSAADDAGDQVLRHLILTLRRPGFYTGSGDEMHRIAVAAEYAGLGRDIIGHDPVAAFGRELFPRMGDDLIGFRRKADHQRRPLAAELGDRGEDVGIFRQRQRRRLAGFLDLLALHLRHPPVGDGRSEDRDVGRQRLFHRGQHLLRRFHSDDAHAGGIGQRHRPAHQHDLGARGSGGSSDRMALLAGGAVADIAHRIDRLMRRTRGDDHALAGQRARRFRLRQQAFDGGDDLQRLGHAPDAVLAALGHLAFIRADQRRRRRRQAARYCAPSPGCSTCADSSPAPAGFSCRWRAARRWRDRRHARPPASP